MSCHVLQESKKWQERKEALDALLKLAEAPKLENADYHELIRTLKKVFVIVLTFYFYCLLQCFDAFGWAA